MLRYRVEYLYIPKSAKLRFTVVVPGGESVGEAQAKRAGDEWLRECCPPIYRWDLALLSAVYVQEEPGHADPR